MERSRSHRSIWRRRTKTDILPRTEISSGTRRRIRRTRISGLNTSTGGRWELVRISGIDVRRPSKIVYLLCIRIHTDRRTSSDIRCSLFVRSWISRGSVQDQSIHAWICTKSGLTSPEIQSNLFVRSWISRGSVLDQRQSENHHVNAWICTKSRLTLFRFS